MFCNIPYAHTTPVSYSTNTPTKSQNPDRIIPQNRKFTKSIILRERGITTTPTYSSKILRRSTFSKRESSDGIYQSRMSKTPHIHAYCVRYMIRQSTRHIPSERASTRMSRRVCEEHSCPDRHTLALISAWFSGERRELCDDLLGYWR